MVHQSTDGWYRWHLCIEWDSTSNRLAFGLLWKEHQWSKRWQEWLTTPCTDPSHSDVLFRDSNPNFKALRISIGNRETHWASQLSRALRLHPNEVQLEADDWLPPVQRRVPILSSRIVCVEEGLWCSFWTQQWDHCQAWLHKVHSSLRLYEAYFDSRVLWHWWSRKALEAIHSR